MTLAREVAGRRRAQTESKRVVTVRRRSRTVALRSTTRDQVARVRRVWPRSNRNAHLSLRLSNYRRPWTELAVLTGGTLIQHGLNCRSSSTEELVDICKLSYYLGHGSTSSANAHMVHNRAGRPCNTECCDSAYLSRSKAVDLRQGAHQHLN